jgi:type II secretory pathway pseudopilin PulG
MIERSVPEEPTMPRHFHDDEDVPNVRRADEGGSSTGLLLALLAVLAVVLVAGAGAVGFFFLRTRAVQEERVAVMMEAQARAAAAARAADPLARPNPPAADGPPADLGPGREPERDGHWAVLFRSDDPAYWDTTGNAAHYAVPLQRAPAGVRFLRLKRTDTGEAMIVAVTDDELKSRPGAGRRRAMWNGTNEIENGARHLGISLVIGGEGLPNIAILAEGDGGTSGSGFGHKRNVAGAGQRYVWIGQEIAKTVFEVAVTDQPLSEDEQKLLVETK